MTEYVYNAPETLPPFITPTVATAPMGSGDLTFIISNAAGFPSPNFRIKIDNEIMLVTNVVSTTFTVSRGQEGTSAAAHLLGASVWGVITAGALNAWLTTSGVASFNTRTGTVTLTSSDVTTALTFTPYNATNPAGYIPNTNVAFLNAVETFTKTQSGAVHVLSVSGNAVAVDMSLSNNFSLTLQATTTQTLSNPSNAVAGTTGCITITQNATPSLLLLGSNYVTNDGTAPPTWAVSTTANAVNVLAYYVVDSTHIWIALVKNGVA
jgi:hypothetical protein